MKTLATLLLVVAGVSLAACGKTNSAYNNSGSSAAPSSASTTTTSSTTPDSASANAPASTSPSSTSGASAATGSAANETLTTGKIKTALATDDTLKGSDISVATSNGVVTLTGTAKTQDQVAAATSIAQKQDGVTRVEANVTVQ